MMTVHSCQQGTDQWLALRAAYFTASEAPAALGVSKYQKRTDLLQQKATGMTAEVGAQKQALFDRGHESEALARPHAEEIVGTDLYPITASLDIDGLRLLASLDGITIDEDVIFEHKLYSESLAAAVRNNCLAPHYTSQMDQQLFVTGAKRCLFMVSDGTAERMAWCWYESTPEKFAALIAGWTQFALDLAAYVPSTAAAPVAAAAVESLPAVSVRMDGALAVQSNLPAFGEALRVFVSKIPAKPTTDQEFADTEAACKSLKKAEEALEAAEAGALASMSDVEAMRRMVADFRNLARTTRLASEKMVEARKLSIRVEIVNGAQAKLDAHQRALNERLGAAWIPRTLGGFGDSIKGKKTVASCEDAVSVALANARIDMSATADRLDLNRKTLQSEKDWLFLFADFATVGTKPVEDFTAIAAQRIQKHKDDEKAAADRAAAAAAAKSAAPVVAVAAPAPAPAPAHYGCAPIVPLRTAAPTADTRPPITTGALCEFLQFTVNADFVRRLGVVPATNPAGAKSGTYWNVRDLQIIKTAIVQHINALPDAPVAAVAREAVTA